MDPIVFLKGLLTVGFFVFLMVVDELFMQIDSHGGLKDVKYCWPLWFGCVDIWTAWEAVFMILASCFMIGVWL